MVSREVNVNRPEHSWIPFYRELAEKLVNEGWRERQGELVGMLREMASAGLRMPPLATRLNENIDPITFLAMFNRSLNWNENRRIIGWLRDRFEIGAVSPLVDPWVPKSNRYVISTARNPEPVWDMIATIIDRDSLVRDEDSSGLMWQFDLCLRNIGISKLTAGMFWVRSDVFLHNDTVNAVGGKDLRIEARDAKSYFACLARTKELTRQSLPELNMSVFKTQNPDWDPPKVWIVRGGRRAMAVEEFLTGGYTGVGFAFGDFDISGIRTVDELRRFCDARSLNQDGIDQVVQFLTEIEISDFVLMPGPGSAANYYGRVTSDPYHDRNGTHRNRRDVEWSPKKISRAELDLSSYRSTVTRPKRDVQDRFLEIIKDGKSDDIGNFEFEMPEDSWVPFHLEVGRKLIEGEWWLPEKRQEFEDMVDEIRWADPEDVGEDYEYKHWSGDPFSFYLSFNMRTAGGMRVPAYRKIKELMQIEAEVPDDSHEADGLGVGWGWDPPLNDEEVSFLWDFFRFAIEFKPGINSIESEQQFIKFYDRAASASFLSGMRGRVLSYLLYWIDPTKYVLTRRLRSQELGLLDDLRGLSLTVSQELTQGTEYMKAVGGLLGIGRANGFTILDVNRKSTTREMLGLPPLTGSDSYTVGDMLDDRVFLERGELERMVRILRSKKNLILQGPPGVGKTFIARKLAFVLMGSRSEEQITSVQFHQSYSYEDFVGGFRPDVVNDRMVFTRQDGPFLRMCAEARANPDVDYVMLIDEINRGNLSRVFGELLMLIEADKRRSEYGVTLQHRPDAEESFFVPENVYIIGTMNLADRSLTGMNVAMRRRFGFVDLEPQFNERVFTDWLRDETEMPSELRNRINAKMTSLNATIADDASLGFNYAVGHSFFCPPEAGPAGGWEEWYETVVEYEIRPLLKEYWFDAPDKANEQADTLL